MVVTGDGMAEIFRMENQARASLFTFSITTTRT